MKKTLVLIVFQGEQIWFLSRSFFRRGQKNWFFQAWEQKIDSDLDFFRGGQNAWLLGGGCKSQQLHLGARVQVLSF